MTGSFQSAAMLSDSWKAPIFAAPSPKLAMDTCCLPSSLAAQPRPFAIGMDDPTTPVVTMQPLAGRVRRSEEHTSELQSLMRISYAVFCLKKKNKQAREREKTNRKF